MGVMRPELVMKSIVPVVMAGVLGIYGLIIAVIISTGSKYVFHSSLENFVVGCMDALQRKDRSLSNGVISASFLFSYQRMRVFVLTVNMFVLMMYNSSGRKNVF